MTAINGRECWTADGRPKRRYSHRADAKNALRTSALRGRDVAGQEPYRCGDCGWFHNGHYPTNQRIREALRARHREAIA